MIDLKDVRRSTDEDCREYLVGLGVIHDEDAELSYFLAQKEFEKLALSETETALGEEPQQPGNAQKKDTMNDTTSRGLEVLDKWIPTRPRANCVFVVNLDSGEVCGQPSEHSFQSHTDPYNEDEQIRARTETIHFCREHWEEHLRLREKGEHAWINT